MVTESLEMKICIPEHTVRYVDFSVLRSTAAVLPIAVFSWKKDGQTRTINHEIVETSLNYRYSMDILLSPLKKTLPAINYLSMTPYHHSKH